MCRRVVKESLRNQSPDMPVDLIGPLSQKGNLILINMFPILNHFFQGEKGEQGRHGLDGLPGLSGLDGRCLCR